MSLFPGDRKIEVGQDFTVEGLMKMEIAPILWKLNNLSS